MRDSVDFVFEEASGLIPSTAETISQSVLGTGRYLDVDPSDQERPKYGIAKETGGGGPIDPLHSSDVYESAFVEEQRKREELWVKRILGRPFDRALVVVGSGHALSVAFRLVCNGVDVQEALWYIPHDKLCTRAHS